MGTVRKLKHKPVSMLLDEQNAEKAHEVTTTYRGGAG